MMIEIKITKVLNLLHRGKTRTEIANYFGISIKECQILFRHEKLKGKKPKRPLPFIIIDDTIIDSINMDSIDNEKLEIDDNLLVEAEKKVKDYLFNNND